MVVRHGRVVAEGWWAPYSRDRPNLLYSLTKSFIPVAVGFAVADGLLSGWTRVAPNGPLIYDLSPARAFVTFAQGVPKAWISRRVGGDQIDYADEQPGILTRAVRRGDRRDPLWP